MTTDTVETTPSQVMIITGLSGAGLSTVANVLEDDGWFVVDNLPPTMIRPLTELSIRAGDAVPRLAVVVDVRGRSFLADLVTAVDEVRARGIDPLIVFLEASDASLVKRFESVRRPHPLQPPGTVLDAIERERELLAGVRSAADLILDTSELNVRQLAAKVRGALQPRSDGGDLHLTILSFGFKHGVPLDAENIADVRFLPNPHWVPELRPRNGLSAEVAEYVLSQPLAKEFLDAYARYLEVVAGGYRADGKRFAVVAVGCTGGKHRSVALAEALVARLDRPGIRAHAVHRDLGRE